jgi:acid stress-induced BolA-like protein IbaG/YrbA
MQVEEIIALVQNHIPDAQVQVQVDGSHVGLVVISEAFEGLNTVKRQQLVYGGLQSAIASGDVHAVQMQTFTPEEAPAAAK